jgi:TonB-linked SusC/RagA family outer membrane protein
MEIKLPSHLRLLCFSISMILLMTANVTLSFAADSVVQGQVTAKDDSSPLPGVSVVVKGTATGTITDRQGNYSLKVPENAALVFSFIGYKNQTVVVKGQSKINVSLETDAASLEEVVVVGYGTQKKSHLTGSVSKITNEKIDQSPVARIDDALTGSIAGVTIQATNPTVGASPTIRVRGTGSITASSNPLVVLDGVVVNSDFLGSLDMNDIESVEVLKDAASAAIYGSRGGNGVIMITSKQGKSGGVKFSYNTYIGNKTVPFNENIQYSPKEWADLVNAENGSLTPQMKYITQLGTVTDWQKVMFDGGMIQNHSLSVRGGTDNTRFNASLGYLGDQGVLLTDDYKKFNFNLNLDTKVNKAVEFGIRLNPSYTIQRDFPIGTHDAIRQSPWLPLYHDANTLQFVDRAAYPNVTIGDYAAEVHFNNYALEGIKTNISTTTNSSVLAKVLESKNLNYSFKTFANTYLKLNIAKHLSFKTSIGGEFINMESTSYQGTKANITGVAGTRSSLGNSTGYHIVNENIFNYDQTFGKHELSLVAGIANEYYKSKSSSIVGTGYNFDFIETLNAAGVIGSATSTESVNTLLSYISRINYAYGNKYLASISLRSDGSSKFGKDNRFGFFPAFSAGWRISEEEFLKNSKWLSDLKLRFSYGTTGNNAGIGDYASIGLISPSTAIFNQAIVAGYAAQNISNSKLRWEKQVETSLGADLSVIQGRFNLSFDYYDRRSTSLLLNQPIPSVTQGC